MALRKLTSGERFWERLLGYDDPRKQYYVMGFLVGSSVALTFSRRPALLLVIVTLLALYLMLCVGYNIRTAVGNRADQQVRGKKAAGSSHVEVLTLMPMPTAPTEPKMEPKLELKVEPKPAVTAEPTKMDPKPESKLESKPEPKLEPKLEPKVEPKVEEAKEEEAKPEEVKPEAVKPEEVKVEVNPLPIPATSAIPSPKTSAAVVMGNDAA